MSNKDIDSSIDKASSKTRKFIEKASEDSKRLAKGTKRGLEKGESELWKIWESVHCWIDRTTSVTMKVSNNAASKTAELTKVVASRVYTEAQNPVVFLNALLAGGAVFGSLYGYAEHRARYLKGKSDRTILATVGLITATILADGFLSYNYYKKLDRK